MWSFNWNDLDKALVHGKCQFLISSEVISHDTFTVVCYMLSLPMNWRPFSFQSVPHIFWLGLIWWFLIDYVCYIVIYTFIQHHNDTIPKTDAWRITHEGWKTQEWRTHDKDAGRLLYKYSPLNLLQGSKGVTQGFACERMLETEHKLHILTPLCWPSRCVFIVLLMLGSTPSRLSEGPLGLVWPSLPYLVSNPLGICWQLHRGFPSAPSVWCGLPYHIWSLLSGIRLATASRVSEVPLGRVWSSLPHLVSTVRNSTGNCPGTQTQLS